MSQCQHYPNAQQYSRMSSTPNAILQTVPESQSTPYGIRMATSAANYNLLHQLSSSAQGALRQTYQSIASYCGYQKTNKKGVYQLNEDLIKNQPESFYTIFNKNDKNVTYADKDFEEVAVHFVAHEALCSKCRATFSSKTKLHYHLKSGYQEAISPSLPAKHAFSIPIIASKAVHQSFGFGLTFRGWTYVTTTVTLAPNYLPPKSNPKSTTCLDTRCEIILVNKNWLAKNLPA